MSDENLNLMEFKCPQCGELSDRNLSICPHCGSRFDHEAGAQQVELPGDEEPQQALLWRINRLMDASALIQQIVSAEKPTEIYRRTVDFLVERLGFYNASFFLVDLSGETATLTEFKSALINFRIARGVQVKKGSQTLVSKVLGDRQLYIDGEVDASRVYLQGDFKQAVRSEMCIPIIDGTAFVAILDIQHNIPNAFDGETTPVIQGIVGHIKSAMRKFQLLATQQSEIQEINALYEASYQLTQAGNVTEVMHIISRALNKCEYHQAVFIVDRNGLRLYTEPEPAKVNMSEAQNALAYPEKIYINAGTIENLIGPKADFKIMRLNGSGESVEVFTTALLSVPKQSGCVEVAFIPAWNAGRIELLFIYAAQSIGSLTPQSLEPYLRFAQMTGTTMSKVSAAQHMEKRLTALQMLNKVSQAVSVGTDLNELYKIVHREVTSIIGKVNFAIAIYDNQRENITIPYMYDGHTTRSIEAYPMGEGLTSIVIRTKQSLMVVEDTENKTRELGAKLVGKPAKSWLGVPMMVGGEVIGAIILQDLENEGRFDEDDLQLLETISVQVAVAVRNARLLETTYQQAARQQMLVDITSKIRSASNISEIMETTASELGRAFGAPRARIAIGFDVPNQKDRNKGMTGGA